MSLTKGFCSKIDVPGKYMDGRGDGLYLLVKPSGAKSWCQRITINGRRRDLGLGSYRFFSLAEVRETAFENRRASLAPQSARSRFPAGRNESRRHHIG